MIRLLTVTLLAAVLAQTPAQFLTQPLVTDIYTADPSAHVFDGRLYVYPSHDIDAGVPPDDLGSHFAMRDYHVLSMDRVGGRRHRSRRRARHQERAVGGPSDVGARRRGEGRHATYLYFPAKDKQDVFRIGVAVGSNAAGPVHRAAAADRGQLQHRSRRCSRTTTASTTCISAASGAASCSAGRRARTCRPTPIRRTISRRSARRSRGSARDMISFAETPRDVVLQDENGKPLTAGDNGRRFFEASWLHKYNGTYYFSYSTGDTHFIMYATGTSPYGPFTVAARSSSRSSAGPTTTRSSSSRGSGISSTTTPSCRRARRTCATSR